MPKCAQGAAEPPCLPCQPHSGALPEHTCSPCCCSGRAAGRVSVAPIVQSVCERGLPVPPQSPGRAVPEPFSRGRGAAVWGHSRELCSWGHLQGIMAAECHPSDNRALQSPWVSQGSVLGTPLCFWGKLQHGSPNKPAATHGTPSCWRRQLCQSEILCERGQIQSQ